MTYLRFNEYDVQRVAEERKKRFGNCPECYRSTKREIKTIVGRYTEHSAIMVNYCPKCGYVTYPTWMQNDFHKEKMLERLKGIGDLK